MNCPEISLPNFANHSIISPAARSLLLVDDQRSADADHSMKKIAHDRKQQSMHGKSNTARTEKPGRKKVNPD
jgi:hypothetical protein